MFETSLIEMIGLNSRWTQVLTLGIMCFILVGIHKATPKYRITRAMGPQVPTFLIALTLSNLHILPAPNYVLYTNIYNIGLPVALAILLLSIDLKAITKCLKPRVFIIMICACFATFFSALIAGFIFRPDVETVKALASCAGAAIGGTENMLATASGLKMDENLIGGVTAINMLAYTVSCCILFGIAGSDAAQAKLNAWIKPLQDPKQIAAGVREINLNKEKIKVTPISLLIMSGAIFVCIGISQYIGSKIPPIPLPGGGVITISWYLVLTTVCLLVGAYTPVAKIEHMDTMGMPLLYLAVMAIFARTDLATAISSLGWFPVVLTMYLLHKVFIFASAKILRVDALTSVTASMAAIGGAASAPMIPTVAGVPELIPLAIIFATIGYAFANYLAWFDGQILLNILHGIGV